MTTDTPASPRATTNAKRLVYFEKWFDPVAETILAKRPDIVVSRLEYRRPEGDTWPEMSQAHGYQIQPRGELCEPWFGNAKLLARCPDMLAICSSGAGYDMVDVNACTAAGVLVCNQSGFNKEAVAEHALGYMLMLSKKMGVADRALRDHRPLDRWEYMGRDLTRKTVGIVGIGNIGTRVAEMCNLLFKMTVLAYDPYLTAEQIAARGATKVELDDLLRRADFVTLHCPRAHDTMDMFGRAQFALMKPTAYFISTARGGVHNEEQLAEAVVQRRIAGAAVDVFLQEPPPLDHPLLSLDNVMVGPHHAGMTLDSMYDMAVATAEQWITIFDGEVPPRLVNPEAWPRYAERYEMLFGVRPANLA